VVDWTALLLVELLFKFSKSDLLLLPLPLLHEEEEWPLLLDAEFVLHFLFVKLKKLKMFVGLDDTAVGDLSWPSAELLLPPPLSAHSFVGESQPLSFIKCMSSIMNLPSLYF
jgi:hypothetical protein